MSDTTLYKSLASWHSGQFKQTFIDEVSQLPIEELLLQQALSVGSMALNDDLSVMINRISEQEENIEVIAGIFFSSIIAGCNCADDPTPVETQPEYCELEFIIDRVTAQTLIRVC